MFQICDVISKSSFYVPDREYFSGNILKHPNSAKDAAELTETHVPSVLRELQLIHVIAVFLKKE